MNGWLIQVKREFWEHQTAFVILPLVIAALIVLACSYIVIMHASPESKIGMEIFGKIYHYDIRIDDETGQLTDLSGENIEEAADNNSNQVEYIIDFARGELRKSELHDAEISLSDYRHNVINSTLYGINSFFITIMLFVVIYYLLASLHTDRKDRSVLFWKSMPVSENRNVAVKIIVSALAIPLVVTALSWVIQICYLVLSMIFIQLIGADPWEVVWSSVNIMRTFIEQLKYVLWFSLWLLPFYAWFLFSSALAKRSPFLVATIPFVVVIVMENLLFGTWSIGLLLLDYLKAGQIQMGNLTGDEINYSPGTGTVNFFLGINAMITGFVIAGLLFPATVWLRNHRFEI